MANPGPYPWFVIESKAFFVGIALLRARAGGPNSGASGLF